MEDGVEAVLLVLRHSCSDAVAVDDAAADVDERLVRGQVFGDQVGIPGRGRTGVCSARSRPRIDYGQLGHSDIPGRAQEDSRARHRFHPQGV